MVTNYFLICIIPVRTRRVFQMVELASIFFLSENITESIRQQKFRSDICVIEIEFLRHLWLAASLQHLGCFSSVDDKIVHNCLQMSMYQASSWAFGSLEGLLNNSSHNSDLWAADSAKYACLKDDIKSEHQKDVECWSESLHWLPCQPAYSLLIMIVSLIGNTRCRYPASCSNPLPNQLALLKDGNLNCSMGRYCGRYNVSWAGSWLCKTSLLPQSHLQSVVGALWLVQALGQPDS